MQKGIGYQEYRKMRMINESLSASKVESVGNERYAVYFGRAHVYDFETGVMARGHLKIGRAKFITALQRGRNQPGIDFRIYAEIVVDTNQATHALEEVIKDLQSHRHILLSQGQMELYDFKDSEIEDLVRQSADAVQNGYHRVLEINLYENNQIIPLKQPQPV